MLLENRLIGSWRTGSYAPGEQAHRLLENRLLAPEEKTHRLLENLLDGF